MPIAVFRADASLQIGAGHIMRDLVLADALAAAGWQTTFACREGTTAVAPPLARSRHRIVPLPDTGDEAGALAALFPSDFDLLVVDHYGLDAAFETALRGRARRILAIDDVADRSHDCDLLLDTSLGRRAEDYAGLVPSGAQLLIGPTYAMLRPQFAAARPKALARRRAGQPVKRILISLGGTDPQRLVERTLEGIAELGSVAAVDVVSGLAPGSASAELRAKVAALPGPVRLLGGVDDMAALMVEADLAVGAGGVTTWERCCLGLPALLVVTADNQNTQAEAVTRAGAALGLGWHADIVPATIAVAAERLCRDARARRDMAEAAAALCDGQGCRRVVEEIEALNRA